MTSVLGHELQRRREDIGWSIAEAARRTGYHRSSIRNMEQGNGRVLFTRYMKYAHTVGYQIEFRWNDDQVQSM